MKLNKLILTAIAGSLFFVSCSSDDDAAVNNPGTEPAGNYDGGVFVLNQGGFGAGNAEVSFLSADMELQNNIFGAVNQNMVLGDTGQDMGIYGDNIYIVLNNSQKIEVVSRATFQHIATIEEGLDNPRYIAFSGDKAYVTNWGNGTDSNDDYVAVINLSSNTVVSSIPVAEGPERIVEQQGKLYVAHAGGYGYGNTVSVINASSNTFVTSINVGDVPNSLEVKDNKLYVMSGGKPSWSTAETSGELDVIDLSTNTVVNTFEFTEQHPSNLDIEGSNIYYTIDSGIFKMDITANTLPAAPFFTTTDQGAYGIYSFAVHDNHIYLGDAGDYVSNGKVYVHMLNGSLHHTYTVGVVPAGFYFN